MDSRELMIGNYVYQIGRLTEIHLPIEAPLQISQIRMFDVEVNGFNVCENKPKNINLSDLSPISLTEDILIRCGFEKDADGFKYQIDNGWYIVREENGYIFLRYNEIECEISHVQYQYLHQIQNLIFALTKEKITLK